MGKIKYEHLTYEQRVILAHHYNDLDKDGRRIFNYREIAKKVGCSHSTISREIRRNGKFNQPSLSAKRNKQRTYRYTASRAHKNAEIRCKLKSKRKYNAFIEFMKYEADNLKSIQHNLAEFQMTRLNYPCPTLRTAYNLFYNGVYGEFNVRYKKRRLKKNDGKTIMDKDIQKKSIHQRTKDHGFEINDFKHGLGHIDIDLIEGTAHKSHVLTMIDRSSMLYLCYKVESKSAASVNKMIRFGLNEFKSKYGIEVKSLCSDNGSEFSYFTVIENSYDINWYFCDPYSSSQRACNERANRDARVIYPKGTDFSNIDAKDIHKKLLWVNSLRRERLNLLTPIEALENLKINA